MKVHQYSTLDFTGLPRLDNAERTVIRFRRYTENHLFAMQ